MGDSAASPVWDYFHIDENDKAIVVCELYNTQLRRGAAWSKSKSFSTTPLWGHVKAKHEKEAAEAKALQDKRAKNKANK